MALEIKSNPDIAQTHSDRLIGYSFDSLTQKNVIHLPNRESAQSTGQAGEQIETFSAERMASTKATRTGKMLLAGFLVGVTGFFAGVFIQSDFSSGVVDRLKAFTPVYAPASTPAPPGPTTTHGSAVQFVPAAVRELPVSPLDAGLPQTEPALAADSQKHPYDVAHECIGPKLALGLCTSAK